MPPQTNDPIENYDGTRCGGDLTEVFTPQLQHPVRPDSRSTSASTRWSTGGDRWGVGEAIPIDIPRPAASTFGNTDDLDQQLPLLAIRGFGQNEVQMVPLHMAMVAVDGRQRRADDEAVRRRGDARPGAACSTSTSRGVEDTDHARDGAPRCTS